MAQDQLDFTEQTFKYFHQNGIESVQWSPVSRQIQCTVDKTISLVVEKRNGSCCIVLKKGPSQIKFSLEQLQTPCDLKQSVLLLNHFWMDI